MGPDQRLTERDNLLTEIHTLEPLNLRKVWPNEAQDFTPWLAKNLSLLASELNLKLELVKEEKVLSGGAGRVDILAKQVTTEAKVVIENQLGSSDHSHCLRLMGYAANADANILVWVARDFSEYHQSILSWLNESDNIAVYAVEVKAYRVGGKVAADFRVVVEPPQSGPGSTSTARKKTTSTYYAEFYRPVIAGLRSAGLAPVGRGGFRGRYRSFQTGYDKVVYSAGLQQTGKATATLIAYGADRRSVFGALIQHRAEIDERLDGQAEWFEEAENPWMWLATEAALDDPSSIPGAVGDWIVENLLRLREVVQPYLNRVMSDITKATDGSDGVG